MSSPTDHEPPTGETSEESDIDRLTRQVTGPEDEVGIASLWRAAMALSHWWFIAVGDEGGESPAAAEVDGRLMLLGFTDGERAHAFAVMQEMIGPDDDLRAIALPPEEVVASAATYEAAGIAGLIFDSHVTGFFIPSEQLPVVWEAVRPSP